MPEERKYEERDFQPRTVGLFAAGLVLLSIMTLISMGWMLRFLSVTPPSTQRIFPRTQQPSVEPALQISPAKDLQEMRSREELQLHSYRWVDPETGIVAIPIERAMDLLVKRGLPVHRDGEKPSHEEKR